ncbi:protein FAM185A isoform X1 [Hemiscyllium ocellatum]|uniref:protein FAM185A isoform X1 n=1 Tax=Hemiscyllium ocellatum TaxID=170820 RepID=UPI0029663A1D|nr:protein FAM185A isoform X1 [Hemiscyllium ocellatum]
MASLPLFFRRAWSALLLREGGPCDVRLRPWRSVSGTRRLDSRHKGSALKRWTLLVDPFGSLKVRLPCDVSVKPLDPHGYPSADRAFVELISPNQRENMDDVLVKYDKALKQMVVTSENISSDTLIDLVTPVKFDLDISTFHKGCVKIKKMESDNCYIETEKGHSILNSLKAHKVQVHSKGGKVICRGTIHGNVDIQTTDKGIVEIEKLQGTSVNISTTDGTLKTKYIYAESSNLSSSNGNIELGNIHGNVTIRTDAGSVIVDSSDGSLTASTQQGDLDIYISQLGIVDLVTQEGSIMLKLPKALRAELQLSGSIVEISPEIQLDDIDNSTQQDHQTVHAFLNGKGEGAHLIKAQAVRGMLNIKSCSWIDTLKLKSL